MDLNQSTLVKRNLLAQARAACAEKRRSTGLDHLRATAVHASICHDLNGLFCHDKSAMDATGDAVMNALFPRSMGVIEAEKRKDGAA